MADGKIVFSTALDNKGLEKDLASLTKKIKAAQDTIRESEAARSPLKKRSAELAAALDIQRGKLEKMKAATAGAFSTDQIKSQAETVRAMNTEWSGVQRQVEVYDNRIAKATAELNTSKKDAGEIQMQLAHTSRSSKEMAEAIEKSEKSAARFKMRLRTVFRRALVFTVITRALAHFRDWVGNVIKSNSEAAASIARLKGALLLLAQPLVDIIIPAFTAFANALTTIISILARFLSAIMGKTIDETEEEAKNLNDETEAMDNLGTSAKKAGKQLAAFDEINKLTSAGMIASAGGGVDFSGKNLFNLPSKIKEIILAVEAKIRDLRFSWDNGTILENRDAWIIAMSGILGAVIGSSFGGLKGGVIGLLLGVSIGLIGCTFLGKAPTGTEAENRTFITVLGAILGAVIGSCFTGIKGAIIGLSLGALITIISLEFFEGTLGYALDAKDSIVVALTAILGAILGGVFGGLKGAIIGLSLGALISFISIEFSEGDYNKDGAIASLRIALVAILGAIIGVYFGGLVGGVIGLILGLTIGFSAVAFDKDLDSDVTEKAKKALLVCITTIIGALIGAVFGGGIFGGIVGGVIGLSFGLAITWSSVDVEKPDLDYVNPRESPISYSLPHLATGAVIPPNRKFAAVLGDQKSGTNIEAPLETIVRAMQIALGGMGQNEAVMVLDDEVVGKLTYKLYNRENKRVGASLKGGAL